MNCDCTRLAVSMLALVQITQLTAISLQLELLFVCSVFARICILLSSRAELEPKHQTIVRVTD